MLKRLNTKTILVFVFAILCLIASISVGIWHNNFTEKRDGILATGQRTTAVAKSRNEVEFISTRGTIRAKPINSPIQGTLQQQDSYNVIYDRDNPRDVVLVQDDRAYDITIWVVATKFLAGSIILTYFGYKNVKKSLDPLPA